MNQYCYLAYDGNNYKIGKSSNPSNRIKTLKTGNPNLELIYHTDNVTESHIHKLMHHRRIKGEFFNLTPHERDVLIQYMKGEIKSINDKKIRDIRSKADRRKRYDLCKMSFGKYKGKRLADIDDRRYLKWVLENTKCNEELKKMIKYKLKITK